jgi:hypothetical protein
MTLEAWLITLRMGAQVTGTGPNGAAAGSTKRAIVRFVAGDLHFQKSAGGNIQVESAAAAVNQRSGSNHEPSFLLHNANRFASRAAGGPNVLDDENPFSGAKLEAAAQGHLARFISFGEKRAYTESARDFVADQNAP